VFCAERGHYIYHAYPSIVQVLRLLWGCTWCRKCHYISEVSHPA